MAFFIHNSDGNPKYFVDMNNGPWSVKLLQIIKFQDFRSNINILTTHTTNYKNYMSVRVYIIYTCTYFLTNCMQIMKFQRKNSKCNKYFYKYIVNTVLDFWSIQLPSMQMIHYNHDLLRILYDIQHLNNQSIQKKWTHFQTLYKTLLHIRHLVHQMDTICYHKFSQPCNHFDN